MLGRADQTLRRIVDGEDAGRNAGGMGGGDAPPAVIYLPLGWIGVVWTPYSCITEELGRLAGVSGFNFEIIETDCVWPGSNPIVSVYVSRPGRVNKTLLMEYGPVNEETLPVISSTGPNAVQISITAISSLFFSGDGRLDRARSEERRCRERV